MSTDRQRRTDRQIDRSVQCSSSGGFSLSLSSFRNSICIGSSTSEGYLRWYSPSAEKGEGDGGGGKEREGEKEGKGRGRVKRGRRIRVDQASRPALVQQSPFVKTVRG